jgi:predicted DNA-binding WGR domain protein
VAKTDDDRSPPPRRFERRGGGSETFWTAALDGSALTVTYGKIGKAGRMRTEMFPGPELARKALDEQIAERLAKGYVEVRAARAVEAGRWDLPEAWQEVYDRIDIQYSRWGKPAPKPTPEHEDVAGGVADQAGAAADRTGAPDRAGAQRVLVDVAGAGAQGAIEHETPRYRFLLSEGTARS